MAYLDPVSDFGKGTITNPPGINSSDTSFTVGSGQGANFPAASLGVSEYYCVVHNATDYSDAADDPNREIIRVRTRSTDSFSNVQRGQLGTSAAAHNTAGKTYRLTLTPTSDLRNKIDARLDGSRTAFSAKFAGADQAIGGGATVTASFDAEEFDDLSEFDTANKKFKALKAGRYLIQASLGIAWTSGEAWVVELRKVNGGTTLRNVRVIANSTSGMLQIIGVLTLAANDEVDVRVTAGASGGSIINNSDRTRFDGAAVAANYPT